MDFNASNNFFLSLRTPSNQPSGTKPASRLSKHHHHISGVPKPLRSSRRDSGALQPLNNNTCPASPASAAKYATPALRIPLDGRTSPRSGSMSGTRRQLMTSFNETKTEAAVHHHTRSPTQTAPVEHTPSKQCVEHTPSKQCADSTPTKPTKVTMSTPELIRRAIAVRSL